MIAALILAAVMLIGTLCSVYFLIGGPAFKPKPQVDTTEWFPGIAFSPQPPLVALVPPPLPAEPITAELEEVGEGVEALHRGRTRIARQEVEQLIIRVRLGADRRDIVDGLLEVHRMLTTVGGHR